MRRLFPLLKAFWVLVVLAVVVGLVTSILFELLHVGAFSFAPAALAFVGSFYGWAIAGFLLLAALTLWAWQDSRSHQAAAASGERAQLLRQIAAVFKLQQAEGAPITATLKTRMSPLLARHALFAGRDAELKRLSDFIVKHPSG